MQRDGQIGGQGPGGGGPDHNKNLFPFKNRVQCRQIRNHGKFDKNRGGRVLIVFHFGFRKGRLAGGTPIDGFFAPDQAAVQGKLAELPDDGGFVWIIHGEIGSIPFSQNTQALELVALNIDIFFRVPAAVPSHFRLGHLPFSLPQLPIHLMFNGQSVAIPAGNIRNIKTGHLF